MRRIKYELYTIRDTIAGMVRIYSITKSLRIVMGVLTNKGIYTDWDGKELKGNYYMYSRNFWFGGEWRD